MLTLSGGCEGSLVSRHDFEWSSKYLRQNTKIYKTNERQSTILQMIQMSM